MLEGVNGYIFLLLFLLFWDNTQQCLEATPALGSEITLSDAEGQYGAGDKI